MDKHFITFGYYTASVARIWLFLPKMNVPVKTLLVMRKKVNVCYVSFLKGKMPHRWKVLSNPRREEGASLKAPHNRKGIRA